jgi:hypothetical protein
VKSKPGMMKQKGMQNIKTHEQEFNAPNSLISSDEDEYLPEKTKNRKN